MSDSAFDEYDATSPDTVDVSVTADVDAPKLIPPPTADEIAAARALLERVAPDPDEAIANARHAADVDPVDEAVNAAAARARIPAHAPKPQDHLPPRAKRSAAEAEAAGAMIVIEMFGERIEIERSVLLKSWDWQIGVVQGNPLQMVKGLLGRNRFMWFCMKAQEQELDPLTASAQLVDMFSHEAGFGKSGN